MTSNVDSLEKGTAKNPQNQTIFQEDSEDFKAKKQPQYARVTALVLGLLALTGIGFGVFFFMDRNDIDLRKETSQNKNFQGTVSIAELVEHQEPEDCWVAIHGNVYDLTEYAPIHPGAPTLITRHCGTDATVWYDYEHTVALLPIVDQYLLGALVVLEEAVSEEDVSEVAVEAETSLPVTSTPTKSPITAVAPVTTSQPTEAPVAAPVAASVVVEDTGAPTGTPTMAQTTATPVIDGCAMERYTVADLAQHADAESCWYGLYGVVYDLTTYIDDHKGGRGTILADCGTDATVNFVLEKKHDVDMLIKKGFSSFIIGRQGATRGVEIVPCEEVELVAVNIVR